MRCISVYTKDFGQFSDIYEEIVQTTLHKDETVTVQGVTVQESGTVPGHYVERMRKKQEVVVMRSTEHDVVILQHGDVFEILLPDEQQGGV